MIRLEYKDEKSSKFWEVSVEGDSHTVRYGRIGSDGQTKTKSFDSAEDAQAAADKLMKAKLKKGYEEVAAEGGAGTRRRVAREPARAVLRGTPAEALQALLAGLCETDEDRAILANLCSKVQELNELEFTFEEAEFTFEPGDEPTYADGVPKSFSDIALSVSELWWDGGGPEVGFGVAADGTSVADGEGFDFLEEDDEENHARISEAGGADTAFVFGQNWTFFDPTRKLKNGEPALAFVSHEEVEWAEVRSADEFNYKQIFLRLISDFMVGTDYIEEVYC